MSFANPWAFLALLAIPLLIIIYIIKNKYREDTDPSTYLWELSRKFLKRKNPISRIEHLINLIVQIVCIFCMSFALASPTITLKGKADNIVFVLDTSASMNLIPQEDNEKGLSRFEQGVEEIRKIASDAKRGSLFTLVSLSDTPEFVCTKVSSLDQFNLYLDSVKASSAASDLSSAIALAQKMYTEE
ncbi:MAG: BatA domain-containing protein, partial [Candidatus Enterosoma sp.]